MLSMSQFLTLEDFLKAQADLRRQEEERVSAVAEPGRLTVKRLVAGVELKLVESGKRWTLGVKKK